MIEPKHIQQTLTNMLARLKQDNGDNDRLTVFTTKLLEMFDKEFQYRSEDNPTMAGEPCVQ